MLRQEFDRELGVVRLLVRGPEGQCLELTESRQLEILTALAERVLPVLRDAERGIAERWEDWSEARTAAWGSVGRSGAQ